MKNLSLILTSFVSVVGVSGCVGNAPSDNNKEGVLSAAASPVKGAATPDPDCLQDHGGLSDGRFDFYTCDPADPSQSGPAYGSPVVGCDGEFYGNPWFATCYGGGVDSTPDASFNDCETNADCLGAEQCLEVNFLHRCVLVFPADAE